MKETRIIRLAPVAFLWLLVAIMLLHFTDVISLMIGLVLVIISGIILLYLLISDLVKYNKIYLNELCLLIFPFLVMGLINSELFKSRQVFFAKTDNNKFVLTLRENRNFKLKEGHPFGFNRYTGTFDLSDNTILLHYKNPIIPLDSLQIICDRIPLKFNESGEPDYTSLYLEIEKNTIIDTTNCSKEIDLM